MCFFFSSRRRHTRYIGDWSSDVCSSDLILRPLVTEKGMHRSTRNNQYAFQVHLQATKDDVRRSEERRVGKECRSWWSSDNTQQKRDKNRKWAYRNEGSKYVKVRLIETAS